jgi:hypothetical protein
MLRTGIVAIDDQRFIASARSVPSGRPDAKSRLAPGPRESLSQSQRQWCRCRDAEFRFIDKDSP